MKVPGKTSGYMFILDKKQEKKLKNNAIMHLFISESIYFLK